jgi:hypothetical protein
MKFEIKRWWDEKILFSVDLEVKFESESYYVQLGAAVKLAVAAGASLDGANLDGARLDGASLDGASLDGANLDGARLDGARLDGASLDGASLVRASLVRARLDGASLDGANLVRASLVRARLDGASLDGARLDGASLDGANLRSIQTDFFDVLIRARDEVPALLAALRDGRVDGSTYEGECACLVGTIAKVRGAHYHNLGNGLEPDSDRPIERWFMGIRKGNTPQNNQLAKITEGWIEEFLSLTAMPPANEPPNVRAHGEEA